MNGQKSKINLILIIIMVLLLVNGITKNFIIGKDHWCQMIKPSTPVETSLVVVNMCGVWQLEKKLNQYGYNTTRGLTSSSTVVAVYGFPPS